MVIHRVAILLLALALPAQSATLFVSKSGDGTTGQSWQTAFPTLGEAIVASTTGEEIWVTTGTYIENLIMDHPVTILGGFAGTEGVNEREKRDPDVNPVVIDGNQQGSVMTVRADLTLDGVTVQHGLNSDGSGINGMGCEIILSEVTINSNGESTNRGGGIFIRNGQLTLDDCILTANRSKDTGGGIYADGGAQVRVVESQLLENVARNGGSGIFLDHGQAEITNSQFQRNKSGGGIAVNHGELSLKDSVMEDNSFYGIIIGDCTAEVVRTSFIKNGGGSRGGGIYAHAGSTYTINQCLFDRNFCTVGPQPFPLFYSEGGAIYSQESKGTVSNSVFSQNQARDGSIASLSNSEPGDVMFVNCTLDLDTDYSLSAGFSRQFTPAFRNCIFVSDGDPDFFRDENADVTFSLIQDGYPGEGNIDADPKFVNAASGDFHLERGSPCIDSGTDTGLTTDFDGNPRPIGRFDMGAFEYPFLRSDINVDGAVDAMDLLILEEDWGLVSGP